MGHRTRPSHPQSCWLGPLGRSQTSPEGPSEEEYHTSFHVQRARVFLHREQENAGGCPWLCIFTRSKTQRILKWWGEPGWYPRCLAPRCSHRILGSQSRSLAAQAWEVPAAFLLPLRGLPNPSLSWGHTQTSCQALSCFPCLLPKEPPPITELVL